jgi:hypothetical protein
VSGIRIGSGLRSHEVAHAAGDIAAGQVAVAVPCELAVRAVCPGDELSSQAHALAAPGSQHTWKVGSAVAIDSAIARARRRVRGRNVRILVPSRPNGCLDRTTPIQRAP